MKSLLALAVAATAPSSAAFQPVRFKGKAAFFKAPTPTSLFSDYLSGLGTFNSETPNYGPPQSAPSWDPAPVPAPQQPQYPSWDPQPARQQAPQPTTFSAPSNSFVSPAPSAPNSQLVLANGSSGFTAFQHATIADFDISKLQPKGPRANADVGQPHDATLKLGQDGSLRSGSWWCKAGGWPSLTQRSTTEIFYVLKGQGCLTDLDGTRHYFGPGDTVILPKGWSGRWDVLEDIHKVWFVHDHPNIEFPPNQVIRVSVFNYRDFAPENLDENGPRSDAIHGSPLTAGRKLFNVGPTEVGVWICTPGSFPVSNRQDTECFHVLEGVFFLTNADGSAQRCGPGDTVILPKGWSGYWDVIETVKKVWVSA